MSVFVSIVVVVALAGILGTVLRLVATRVADGQPVTYLGASYVGIRRSRNHPTSSLSTNNRNGGRPTGGAAMTATAPSKAESLSPEAPSETLGDLALELAVTDNLDLADAAERLAEQSDRDRALIQLVHTAHVRRMLRRPSDDFDDTRALLIIEAALRRLPR